MDDRAEPGFGGERCRDATRRGGEQYGRRLTSVQWGDASLENSRVAGTRRSLAAPALFTLLLSPPIALLHAAPASAQGAGNASASTAQAAPEVQLAPAPTSAAGGG